MDDENRAAIVDFKGLKFKLAFEQLRKLEKKHDKEKSESVYFKFDASSILDIRGKRSEEVKQLLDDFLSDAILGNIKRVTIIHGKGTGALKQIVHNILKHHPSVEYFRIGELTEGGAGVTVVDLK
jgi:DNA mismatch repair protein MutS2